MAPLVTGKPKLKPTGCRHSEGAFFPRPFGLRIWMALGTMAALFGGGQAKAVTYTWDGDGGNVNWSTIGNWAEGVAPIGATTTNIIFAGTNNTGTIGTPLNQDIINPMVLDSLSFSAGSGTFFLAGLDLRFGGSSNTIAQNSSSAQNIANTIRAPSSGVVTLTLAGDGTGVVTLSGVVSAGVGGRDYAILKTGSSTFSLTGTNTYGGGTTINGGIVVINTANSLGGTAAATTINAGTLEVAGTFSTTRLFTLGNAASTFLIDPGFTYTATGIISGTGTLNKTGTGTMVLGGNNTFSGGTNISAGTLQLGASDRLLNTGALTLSGGTFNLVTFSETVGLVTLVSGSITGTSGILTGSSFELQSGTVSAILGGIGGVTKSTAGTVTLSGVNTYSGGTTINGGIVVINTSSSLGAIAGATTINAGTLEVAGTFSTTRLFTLGNAASTFLIDPGFTYTANGVISGTGALNKTGTGTMVLGGNNTFSGGTNISAGTLQINASDRLLNTGALTVSGGTFNLVTFSETVGLVTLVSGSITGTTGILTGSSYVLQSGTVSAILGGTAALTKSASGTVTLSGVNTFTGSATVNDGILIAAATSGSALGSASSIAINSDGTLSLGANNQINNTVTMTLAGGRFAKGDFSEGSTSAAGVGTLTLTGSDSHLDFGIGAVGTLSFASFAPGTETLLIDNWTGTANTIGTASTDRLVFAADQTGNLSNFWFTGYESGASQFALGGGYFEVVPFAPVPEPSANYLLAIAALAAVAWSQRRRWRCFLFRGGRLVVAAAVGGGPIRAHRARLEKFCATCTSTTYARFNLGRGAAISQGRTRLALRSTM